MKRSSYILLTIIQFLLLISIYILNVFTRIKLGMNRWVVYNNLKLNKNSLISNYKNTIPIVIVFFSIYFIKKNYSILKKTKIEILDMIVLIILSLIIFFGIILLNNNIVKLYYFYSFIALALYIIQLIKILLQIRD